MPIPLPEPFFAGNYRQPAEWEKHEACWLAWPSHAELWQDNLGEARREFVGLCEAILDFDPQSGQGKGERLEVLVKDSESLLSAQAALGHLPTLRFHSIPFGDIWIRDTGPIFLHHENGDVGSVRFDFNGWGGKYVLPFDAEVSAQISLGLPLAHFHIPWICEGGSIEVDGEGTCLTTRQCLLNSNRNSQHNEEEIENLLKASLGVEKILWLGDGLVNDHTDGHIDTLARFVSPGVVMCMRATDDSDPNFEILEKIFYSLSTFEDAQGRLLKVLTTPSAGRVLDNDLKILPASYMNFYIANTTVVVPTYGTDRDAQALQAIQAAFPTRKVLGRSARAILSGGGAFHCITQQQPLPKRVKFTTQERISL